MSYPVEWLEYKNEINVSKDVKTSEPLMITDMDCTAVITLQILF